MRRYAIGIGIALAVFSPLFFAYPATADWAGSNVNVSNGSVQFDYRGGSASQTIVVPADAVNANLTLTVNNTIANRIGGGELADTWSVQINDQRFTGAEITTSTISVPVSGTVTITVEGIDRGFWAGWYGPIFSAPDLTYTLPVPVVAPEPNWWADEAWEGATRQFTAPDGWIFASSRAWYGSPTDENCGADVSAVLTALLVGQSSVSVALDNGTFGDPCGGVVKVTRYTWSVIAAPQPVTDTVRPVEPTPVEPTPEPTPTPSPAPEPLPVPTNNPEPPTAPTPAPEPPAPAPEPQPEPEPAAPPVEPLPAETPPPPPPAVEPPPPAVEPNLEPNIEPSLAPTPPPPPPAVVEPPKEVAPPPPAPPSVANVDPATLNPAELTTAQVAELTAVAIETLSTAEQGSPAYEQALEQLLVVAEADDAELPEALASVPLLGNVASAVLDAFNSVGNIGADMSPKQREQAKKEVVATIAIGQAVMSAGLVGSASYRRGV